MTNMNGDSRSTAELFKQWRKLAEVQRNLTKNGLLNANATPSEVIAQTPRSGSTQKSSKRRSKRRNATPRLSPATFRTRPR